MIQKTNEGKTCLYDLTEFSTMLPRDETETRFNSARACLLLSFILTVIWCLFATLAPVFISEIKCELWDSWVSWWACYGWRRRYQDIYELVLSYCKQ